MLKPAYLDLVTQGQISSQDVGSVLTSIKSSKSFQLIKYNCQKLGITFFGFANYVGTTHHFRTR